jgi:hypothetical protein
MPHQSVGGGPAHRGSGTRRAGVTIASTWPQRVLGHRSAPGGVHTGACPQRHLTGEALARLLRTASRDCDA